MTLFANVGNVFKSNYADRMNAPADEFGPGIELDGMHSASCFPYSISIILLLVTFYKISVKNVEFMWKTGQAALLVQLPEGLKFDSNDLGAHLYRKVSSVRIPKILFRVLATISEGHNTWLEAGEIDTDLMLDIYAAPIGYQDLVRKQLAFVEEQDKSTDRAKSLFHRLRRPNTAHIPSGAYHILWLSDCTPDQLSGRISHISAVYLPQPSLPVYRDGQPPDTQRPHPTKNSRPDRRGSWRFSALANLSDSEGEEGVSEADRDARLA